MSSGDDEAFLVQIAPEYLRSLADWLNSEEVLRGRVHPVRRTPEPGELGAAVELLTVALGSGGAGAVLVRSISAWLSQRRSEVSVSLKDADGREFRFSSSSARQDPSEVFREASALFASLGDESCGQEQAGR